MHRRGVRERFSRGVRVGQNQGKGVVVAFGRMIQRVSDSPRQLILGKRLEEKRPMGLVQALTDGGIMVVMPGDIQRPHCRACDGELIGEPEPTHAGHFDVGHEQVDRIWILRSGRQGLLASARVKDGVALVVEHPGDQIPDDGIVVDQQDRFPVS